MMDVGRRGFITGVVASLVCAPAIVRSTSLMALPAKRSRVTMAVDYAIGEDRTMVTSWPTGEIYTLDQYAKEVLNPMVQRFKEQMKTDKTFHELHKDKEFFTGQQWPRIVGISPR